MNKINRISCPGAILTALMLMPVFLANATSVLETSMDEMIREAEFVFEGRVIAVESRQTGSKHIYTYITFEIMDIVKGQYSGSTVTLRFLGGTVGDRTMVVSDMCFPRQGEQGIYFVESLERNQVNPLFGWNQGHFVVGKDPAGTERIMTNKKLPVIGIKAGLPDTGKDQSGWALSRGAARDVIVGQAENEDSGLTVEEFKKMLHDRKVKAGE